MPATVTLSSTTFSTPVASNDRQVQVASLTGLVPGQTHLFVDRELMRYLSPGIGNWINVLRGVEGTHARAHNITATVYEGRADQFYTHDPSGQPSTPIGVYPWINLTNGTIWTADDSSSAWTQISANAGTVVTTTSIGALGIQQTTQQ